AQEYMPLIEKIRRNGATYSLLSVHAYAEGAELERIRDFLKAYPPLAMHTRDTETFSKFNDLNFAIYDGICFAFFVGHLSGIPKFSAEKPYLAISYHSGPDPDIQIADGSAGDLIHRLRIEDRSRANWRVSRHFDFLKRYPL